MTNTTPTISPTPETQARWETLDTLLEAINEAKAVAAIAAVRSVISQVPNAASARIGWNFEENHPDFEAFIDKDGNDLDLDPLLVWDSIQALLDDIHSSHSADALFDRRETVSIGAFFGTQWYLDAIGPADDATIGGAATLDALTEVLAADDIGPLVDALRTRQLTEKSA